jgi:hypothetical protein
LIFAILIWWNDNALFGAQPETVFLAFFLGALRSVGSSLIIEQRVALRSGGAAVPALHEA